MFNKMTKIYKQIVIEEERKIEIDEITLLSLEEYETYQNAIPKIAAWWWLRSPNASIVANAPDVDNDGLIHTISVTSDDGIRPALRIKNPESFDIGIGDKFRLAGDMWTMIGDGLALCDDVVGNCAFRKNWKAQDANIYEKSDIKKWLENWAEENGIERKDDNGQSIYAE